MEQILGTVSVPPGDPTQLVGGRHGPPDGFSPRPSAGSALWLEEGRQPSWGRRTGCRASGTRTEGPPRGRERSRDWGSLYEDHKSLPESRLQGSVRASRSQTKVHFRKTLSRWSPASDYCPDLLPGPLTHTALMSQGLLEDRSRSLRCWGTSAAPTSSCSAGRPAMSLRCQAW